MNNYLIKIRLVCFWTTPEQVCKDWSKMSQDGKGRWNNIQIVPEESGSDYTAIINYPNCAVNVPKDNIILYHMEPLNFTQRLGELADPPLKVFKSLQIHKYTHNNIEWHISSSYQDLINNKVDLTKKFNNEISAVLSSQYSNIGHQLRIKFAKYMEDNGLIIHHFGKGGNPFNFKNHFGELPYMHKDSAQFPYKYTFNAENNSEKNYFTEKIIDAILSETLCFYWGCPNISDWIDPRAYIILDFNNFEDSLRIVKDAIENNEWEKRLNFIKEAKVKILNELQFFPTLEKIVNSH